MEQTDESIREALKNLPPDLSTTYDRMLRRSNQGRGHSYQRQILSFLLAAFRPLEMNELREALAVVPGDTNWKSDNQVNNIYRTLGCCESLVIVAEEERTAHFVHQSVVQFLLDKKSASTSLHFDLAQASLGLGEVCVTYLNYEMFDQRMSTSVVPTIPAGVIPAKVAQDTLQGTGLVGELALKLLNLQVIDGPRIGKILAETGRIHRKRQETAAFGFLKYASQHWLIHTAKIKHTHSTFSLWKGLLQHSKFDGLVWGPNKIDPDKLLVGEKSGTVWTLAPRVTWAISHSHLSLLMLELRSKKGLKAFCSIIPYIRVLVRAGDRFKVDAPMALKLFNIAVVGEADDIANLILRTHQTSCSREAFLDPFVKQNALAKIGWIISLKYFGSLDALEIPIVELACHARNLQILDLALNLGARIGLYNKNPLVILLKRMQDPLDLALACRLLEARFSLKGCDWMGKQLYWFFCYYALVNDHNNFDPYRAVMYSLGSACDSISIATFDGLIRRACYNGNLQMVKRLLNDGVQLPSSSIFTFIPPETLSLWMTDALRTYSIDRKEIVQLLIRLAKRCPEGVRSRENTDDWNSIWLDVFRRCLQLRAWELADAIRRVPNLQEASFRKALMNSSDGNRKTYGQNTNPTSGDPAQHEFGDAHEDRGEAGINIDASAQKAVVTDEHEKLAFETSTRISLIHLSASCGDVAGAEFLLDVLASDAHMILSAPSPLDSCFGGDVPLQIVLSQEQSTVKETANLLKIGCMFLGRIGAHGSSACGQISRSCANLAPWFCAKVVQRIAHRDRKILPPATSLYRFWGDEASDRCFVLLQDFLRTWMAHLPSSAQPRKLLIPMLGAIIRGFGEVNAAVEDRLFRDKNELQCILKVESMHYIDLGFVLVQIMGTAGFDDMLQLFLLDNPSLQDDVAGFKGILFQWHDI